MRRDTTGGLALAVVCALAGELATAGPAAAADPSDKIVRLVDSMAEVHVADPAEDPEKVCQWATQVVTYQGVSHTRRVRVCEHRTWWEEMVAKAKGLTSRAR